MTACNAVIECRHKIAFVSTLTIEKLLSWFPLCAFIFSFVPICVLIYSSIIFSFLLMQSWVVAAATNRWLQPLLLRATWSPDREKNLQAVNELPSMPSVKGVYKLTEALSGLSFAPSLFPALATTFSLILLPSPLPPISRSLSCSSIFSLYLPASRSSGSVAGAVLSGSGSEQHSLSVRFMFRISHLMRTKEINWWFKPNETSVKLTGLINGNK